jgi:hypothetical protein
MEHSGQNEIVEIAVETEPVVEVLEPVNDSMDAVLPIEVEPVKPEKILTKEQIIQALNFLSKCDDADSMYLPEFYCEMNDINFKQQYEPMSMKDVLQTQAEKPKTKAEIQRERMRKKLEQIKINKST